MTKFSAVVELLLSGALWGFGFVATIWSLRVFTPVEVLVYRMVIAVVVGELLYLAFRGAQFRSIKKEVLSALPVGFILAALLILQTIGLQYTTATKSGFLTSLYVILVPLINTWFFKNPGLFRNYIFAALALCGTFMLMDANLSEINVGDLWTIACSVMAALHIIYIGKASTHVGNAFRFNNFQSLWCLLALLPLSLTQKSFTFYTADYLAWIGIFCLGLGSSLIAFYIQVRAQKVLSDSTASMLFLLESPFAALFGFLILNERLNIFQISGAVIILVASILQIVFDASVKKKKMTQK